ncbi:uncharacterized protein TRUGW13939_11556 [Talaromyces rugulosus]|uniref:Uncharacterized protein n=1 Tax=Talaromyces rugulosus TaxID=121627 RepID=A0A7H8RD22_TALRU|nr:uncharacterized protein TRUGW13939_11556 [Talaromyces rugulosus]QKX64382.1 hypothetical protein TRUGW13939_11556 [Talaromyces rugulosus]
MASPQDDLLGAFDDPFPSQHISILTSNPEVRERVKYEEREYRGYAIFDLPEQFSHGELSIDPAEFLQIWLPSSLVFSVNMQNAENPRHVWFVFHQQEHDQKAVEFFGWVLGEHSRSIRPDISTALSAEPQTESMINKICGRAYVKCFCHKQYWPLYPKFVYFLILLQEELRAGENQSESDDDEMSEI